MRREFLSPPTDALETHPALLPYHVELTQLGAIALFFKKWFFASFYSCALNSLVCRSKLPIPGAQETGKQK